MIKGDLNKKTLRCIYCGRTSKLLNAKGDWNVKIAYIGGSKEWAQKRLHAARKGIFNDVG